MNKQKQLNIKRKSRSARVRAVMFGTKDKPRLSIHKTNKFIYLQLIDDEVGKTLISISDRPIKTDKGGKKDSKIVSASDLGLNIAKLALEKGIKSAIADRGMYKYHGNVKSIIESARKGGLKI